MQTSSTRAMLRAAEDGWIPVLARSRAHEAAPKHWILPMEKKVQN